METSFAPQKPSFGVEAGAVSFIINANFGPEIVDECIKSASIGRTEVRRGYDAERDAALLKFVELVLEQSKALPLDKSTQQVDLVGARKLGAKFGGECGFVARVCHQRGVGEWSGGSRQTGVSKLRCADRLVEARNLVGFDLVQRLANSVTVGEDPEDPTNEFYTELSAAGATHSMFDDWRKMARDRQRLLGFVDSAILGLQIVLLIELLLELVRQQRLVYPPVHEPDVSGL
jgi:hypothetical protein